VRRYDWRNESALVTPTFQAPLKSLNYLRRRHVLISTQYNIIVGINRTVYGIRMRTN
jgi:hypothetical protein